MIPLLENRDLDSKLFSINVNLRYQKVRCRLPKDQNWYFRFIEDQNTTTVV